MPNGHGGVPFLGGPIVLAILFTCFVSLPLKARLGWAWVAICLIFAALVGWRLAYTPGLRSTGGRRAGTGLSRRYMRSSRRLWAFASSGGGGYHRYPRERYVGIQPGLQSWLPDVGLRRDRPCRGFNSRVRAYYGGLVGGIRRRLRTRAFFPLLQCPAHQSGT
jgi:hypothetical protein